MKLPPLLRPMGLDRLADVLADAAHHTATDRGATRIYQGQCHAGNPFIILMNTFDGLAFAITAPPAPRLVAANDPAP